MESAKYQIEEQLASSPPFLLYKAIQEDNDERVILKMLNPPYSSEYALHRIESEFSILQSLPEECVVHARSLDTIEARPVLILEDDEENISLADYLKKELPDLNNFFTIALQLARALQTLHAHRILHKNITPSCVLLNPLTKTVKLTGFNLATKLAREALYADAKDFSEAELAYISPEQTGRINSTIDYRADLYSLGAVLYELLTGRPPFVSADPMTLVHSHIAKQPKAPETFRADTPKVLSAILLKLLAKSRGDRYQSIAGVISDLQHNFTSYQSGIVFEHFVPGEKDVSDLFRISEKIYGRKAEMQQVQQALQRVNNGTAEVMIVAGYSGVGKSSLVKQVQKSSTGTIDFFISGKCDPFKKNEPLSSLLSAFRQLIQQLLMLDESSVAGWRSKVIEAVGATGQVMIDVLPEVELLIGKQPSLPALPPVEITNRFTETFSRFVKVFCRPNNPLCIFLDDLQWMDSATRQWIETQLAGGHLSHLLLIGAYRDNEVTASHPLLLMLDRLAKDGVSVTTLTLSPLSPSVLCQMVADTLHLTHEDCTDLCDIIFQKTNGNPFFTRQCLLSLHDNNAIYFDTGNQRWACNLPLVHQAGISDNVIELMVQLIQRLPQSIQQLLMSAACIGSRFDLLTVSAVSNKTISATHAELTQALEQGLIMPFDTWQNGSREEFVFLHDRVQQALLDLLPEDEKKIVHLQIGRVLLAGTEHINTEEKIYDIANHLNYAQALITADEERLKLSEVNLAAGIRARNASAYEQAKSYITTAMHVLPQPARNKVSVFNRELCVQRADCEHLCGNNEVAEQFYNDAVLQSATTIEKAGIAQRKIQYYINVGKFTEAYGEGRKAVKTLGVDLPSKFIPPLLIKDVLVYRALLGRRKVPDLINLPDMKDERMKAAVLLMSTLARAAYQIKPELCVAVCFKIVNACLRYGNTQGGNVGFLAVGPIFFGAILKLKQTGYNIGQLTLALVEKYKSYAFKAEAHFVIGYFSIPWRKPAAEMERYWQIAYESGLEAGDLFHASCACCGTVQSLYMRGASFDEIEKTSDRYLEFLHRINNKEAMLTQMAVTQSIYNLRGETASKTSYDTDRFTEADYITNLQGFGSRHFAHYYYINKMQTLYLWGAYTKAYEVALQSDKYLKDSPGMLHTAEHYFYKGLIICALYPEAGAKQQLRWRMTLNKINRNFSSYAEGCEANFIHKAKLLFAETQRVYHHLPQAENAYYAAIETAAAFGYTNITALANELFVRFHYDAGRRQPAHFHLINAVFAYRAWGATGYAKFLYSKYSGISGASKEFSLQEPDSPKLAVAVPGNKTNNLDFDTVLKSSEAISREIRLPDLLSALMKIMIENAGAQRMVLLLQQDKELVVYAERTADTDEVKMLDNILLDDYDNIARSVVYYVARRGEPLILEDAQTGAYGNDIYIKEKAPRSVLCAPLVKQGKLTGVIYIENNLTEGAFTQDRIDLLILLSGQTAIAIENALLYNSLEEKVIRRTEELKSKNSELEVTLKTLQESQRRLVQAEKMASLGQMASGVAHEIQNPLNFVVNFASVSVSLLAELKELLQQDEKSNPEQAEDIEAILDDLQSNNKRINAHGLRAENIVRSMMQTSALMESKKPARLAALLDEAMMRAENNFIKNKNSFDVAVVKEYSDDKEEIVCATENLINVFMNMLDNSLYTVYEKRQKEQNGYQPQITMKTERIKDAWQIKIRDNGEGIPQSNMNKVFVPFFTTKPTGKGNTGNGLTSCYRVITETHNGDIEVISDWGNFTEFIIVLPVNN